MLGMTIIRSFQSALNVGRNSSTKKTGCIMQKKNARKSCQGVGWTEFCKQARTKKSFIHLVKNYTYSFLMRKTKYVSGQAGRSLVENKISASCELVCLTNIACLI
jgi:hypothetical protein